MLRDGGAGPAGRGGGGGAGASGRDKGATGASEHNYARAPPCTLPLADPFYLPLLPPFPFFPSRTPLPSTRSASPDPRTDDQLFSIVSIPLVLSSPSCSFHPHYSTFAHIVFSSSFTPPFSFQLPLKSHLLLSLSLPRTLYSHLPSSTSILCTFTSSLHHCKAHGARAARSNAARCRACFGTHATSLAVCRRRGRL